MTFVIKKGHRYEDETFPSPVAMLQWINGRCAALKDSWELTDIHTSNATDGKPELWCGLEFTALKTAQQPPELTSA